MTIIELRRLLAESCEPFHVSEEEMRRPTNHKSGRREECLYVHAARSVFIVRALVAGVGPCDLAGFLRVSTRTIARWRTILIQRGLVAPMPGRGSDRRAA